MIVSKLLFSLCFLFPMGVSVAQEAWTVEGSAFTDGEQIVLTPDEPNQGGAAWSPEVIDLNKSFTLEFLVHLGKDAQGADGIAFVLTPSPEYRGATGGTLGVEGISPSVSINIYTLSESGDSSVEMTVRLNAPGDYEQLPLYRVGNLTDGQEHSLRISWNAPARLLRAYIGSNPRPRILYFLPESVFDDETRLYYGFTGATGDLHNLHYFIPIITP